MYATNNSGLIKITTVVLIYITGLSLYVCSFLRLLLGHIIKTELTKAFALKYLILSTDLQKYLKYYKYQVVLAFENSIEVKVRWRIDYN